MKSFITQSIIISVFTVMVVNTALAERVVIPNTFESGTAAIAAEVNENFDTLADEANQKDTRLAALEEAVAALQSTVASLQGQVASLQADLAAVSGNSVLDLEPHIQVDSDARGPLIVISGANVQIVNGQDQGGTETINGLGNLIVGYDEENANTTSNFEHCSDGTFGNQETCESNGAIWSHSHKSGSHNIVVGSENSYASFGGIVAGKRNFITNEYAGVLSGFGNVARGTESGVSGGGLNEASGSRSTVAGGNGNTAGQFQSSIGGGIGVLVDLSNAFGTWAAGSLVEEP